VRHTLNEIEVLIRKAAVGAGYVYGIAEDIGQAGAWLCAHGQDGVAACLAGIEAGPSAPAPTIHNNGTLSFVDAHVARCGSSALDLIMSNNRAGDVRLANVDEPLLLVGLAGIAADAWNTDIALRFSDGCTVRVGPAGFDMPTPPAAGVDVILVRDKESRAPSERVPSSDGFDVDADLWNGALKLAARTYVPASEASRARGAGAGEIDNE
jgi:hypothetical protein